MNERGIRDLAKRRNLSLFKLRGDPRYVVTDSKGRLLHDRLLDLDKAAALIRKYELA